VERGAAKVYAAVRNPDSVDLPGVVPLRLDITDPASVAAAAAVAGDVTLRSTTRASTRTPSAGGGPRRRPPGDGDDLLRHAAHGAYSSATAASWAMTNTLRLQLAPKGITTTALHVGYMDTDMVAQIDSPKGDPAVIAALALDGVQAGAFEVVADEKGKMVRSLLSA
jgi:NAD(P)-dependent dehydrogenase (short-subunit alcohol dehydrogenase family)